MSETIIYDESGFSSGAGMTIHDCLLRNPGEVKRVFLPSRVSKSTNLVKLTDEPLKSLRPGRPAGTTHQSGGSQPASRIKPLTEVKVASILQRLGVNYPS